MLSSLGTLMTRPIAMVTGASGFIGRHVVDALSTGGHDVLAVGRGTAHPLLTSDHLAPLCENLALIVFCAGGSSVGQSLDAPLVDFQKTVPPLVEILELMRSRAPAARLVVLSSAAVYGQADQLPTAEDAPVRAISPYGVHKRISEQLCVSWASSYRLHVAVVRLFSVYGPGLRKQLLWDACRKGRAGERRFAGTGQESRDWLHVSDAVSLILAAAGAASPEVPIFNGGTGVATSVADFVGDAFAILGASAPQFSGSARPGDPARYLADISRAQALGWRPRVDVKQGIREYVSWFLEQE